MIIGILVVVAMVVLFSLAFKSYASTPTVIEWRSLTQKKASPEEAVVLTKNVKNVILH